MAHHRLAVHRLQQLVAPAHPARLTGRENDDGDLAPRGGRGNGGHVGGGAPRRGPAELLLEKPARSPIRELPFREREIRADPPEEEVRPARGRGARRPGKTDHRNGPDPGPHPSIEAEVAGVDGKPETVHGPPCRLDGGGHHVAAVHDRGRAEDDQKVAAGGDEAGEGGRHLALLVRAAALGFEARTDAGELVPENRGGLVQHRRPRAGQHGEDEPGASRAELRHPNEPSARRTMPRHASRCGRRTAKGITLTVAARRRGSTTVIAGSVARVSSSPTAFTAATPSSSTVSTPRTEASRLQRPVNAVPVTSPVRGAGPTPDPPAAPAARVSASSRAASFSATSSGSRRAVTTESYPASRSAVTSSAERRWPFLSTRAGSRNPWASIASSASRSGVGPKRTDVPGPTATPRGPAPGASR